MKDFSFFERACQISHATSREDQHSAASISRRQFDERQTFIFQTRTPGLEYACLLIENTLVLQTNRHGRIYAGFEKLSYLRPIVDRYLRIADVSQCVYIFGEPDWIPPRHPNIKPIFLAPDYRLAREHFLIVDSPDLKVALVAKAEDGLADRSFDQRQFRVLKTSSEIAVMRLVSAAETIIDQALVGSAAMAR